VGEDRVEEGLQAPPRRFPRRAAVPARAFVIMTGKSSWSSVASRVDEEVVDLVDHLVDPGVGPVDLVDDEDDGKLPLEGFLEHEAGLRKRALGGVHEQQHRVDHLQRPLQLAAEIGVDRGIDDVDLDAPVDHGGVSSP